MLAEFEIIPIGTGSASLSGVLAEVAELIHRSGLDYRLGAMGTAVEGEWEPIMALAKRCRDVILRAAPRVVLTIRIDDRTDKPGPGRLTQKIESLEAKVGHSLKR